MGRDRGSKSCVRASALISNGVRYVSNEHATLAWGAGIHVLEPHGAFVVNTREGEKWAEAREQMVASPIMLGPLESFHVRHTPRRLLHMLSYYKFAAKMIGAGKRVLDVGCSEGLGTGLVAEFSRSCVGVDIDPASIAYAAANMATERLSFVCGDILAGPVGEFDAAVTFDVIEHIYPDHEAEFLTALGANLTPHGLCVIGTPNITSDRYANPPTRAGHVNLYSAERLRSSAQRHFTYVFIFSANDEVVHTGFSPLAHYLIALCAGPIEAVAHG